MRRPISAFLLTLALVLLAGAASADGRRRFDIPSKPIGEALIDFAIQANVTVGGSVRCTGRGAAVVGVFTIKAGLTRLLDGASCRFVMVSPDTIRIIPAAAAAPASSPSAARAPVRVRAAAPQNADAVLPEVVVTATRRGAVASHLAEPISVIGADAIRQSGATDANAIAGQLAGLTTTNLGPGRDKILLRGLSDGVFTGRTESTVGIYLNDTPITFNAPDPDLRLADVKSVEVLRGPQGFLYGGGSLSGVYRIVTQEPKINQGSESMLVGGSLTEAGAPSAEGEAVVNLPLIEDKAALRAVVYDENDGGYIDNATVRKSNVDSTTRLGGRSALRLLLGQDWIVTLAATAQSINTNDTQYVDRRLGRNHIANHIAEASNNNFGQASLTLERNAAWGDVKSTTAVTRHAFFDQTDASNALLLFGAANARVGAYDEPTTISRIVEDAVVTSPNAGRLRWLAGVFGSSSLEQTDPDVRANATALTPSQVLYVEHRRDTLDELALYGEVSYALASQWTLEAGLRWSDSTITTTSLVNAPVAGRSRRYTGGKDSESASPKVALKYQASDRVLLYALASEGHRAGGFNTGGPIGITFGGPGANLPRRFGADQLWNLEAGAKGSLLDDRLILRAAAFYDIWNNIQTDQFLNSGISYTANAGNGRNIGAESEIAYKATDHIDLRVNALINSPELLKGARNFVFPGHVGLPGVPDVSGGATAAVHWSVGEHLMARLSAQSQYVGRSRVTFNPLTSPETKGYTLNQLSAQLAADRWRLSAFLSNPTNSHDNTFSYGNPFNFQQIAEVTPQRPLTVRLTLGVDF
jgi:outer membrane receptor protein involved in Fe transport